MGIPERRQLVERFAQILYQGRRGSAALKFRLRPGMAYPSGLDFQKALLARG